MGMSDLNERLNQLEQGALNFLFPRRCPFCNQHIGSKELICAGCRKEAALHRGPGRPPDLLGPGGRASVLRGRRPPVPFWTSSSRPGMAACPASAA